MINLPKQKSKIDVSKTKTQETWLKIPIKLSIWNPGISREANSCLHVFVVFIINIIRLFIIT